MVSEVRQVVRSSSTRAVSATMGTVEADVEMSNAVVTERSKPRLKERPGATVKAGELKAEEKPIVRTGVPAWKKEKQGATAATVATAKAEEPKPNAQKMNSGLY